MAEPFVLEALPPVPSAEKRNSKTVNRDLSTMSTVARHLANTAWAPKIPNTMVLDFPGATITIKHYSKLLQTEGLETVLGERLEFICRYVPTITAHLTACPIRLLPIEDRSRVGSGRHRKMRSDAGGKKSPSK